MTSKEALTHISRASLPLCLRPQIASNTSVFSTTALGHVAGNQGCDEASGNLLPSDMDFTFNIHTDSNADADLLRQLLVNSVTKQELRITL